MKELYVFIGYSRKDSEIARFIDASLLSAGVRTFRDEKDILVGDSFPERLYEGLTRASHLLYILSANSVASKWVQEELSVAKVKEKEVSGFKILPVLVDEVDLPIAIRHVHYADFRNWQDRDSYRRSFLAILRSIGVTPKLLGTEDLIWYAHHSGEVRGIHSKLQAIQGQLYGGLTASIGSTQPHHYMATKYAIREDDVVGVLARLSALLDGFPTKSSRLEALGLKVNECVCYANESLATRSTWESADKVDVFQRLLGTVVAMIDELRGEVETALLASVLFDAPERKKEQTS
jgi:hypothetical protein